MPKLTKRLVDSLECTSSAPAYLWDEGLAGFGVKALPGGGRRYVVKYRAGGGGRAAAQRWLTLGAHGPLTCEQARAMAQQVLAAVARGEDPQASRFEARSAPRLADVWTHFAAEQLPRKKPQTRREYDSQWRDLLAPALGRKLVRDLTRPEVDRLHKGLSNTPYRANRVLALLSRLMSLAEAWGWRDQGTNPCRYVERFPEQSRSRFLTFDEIRRVGQTLEQLVDEEVVRPCGASAIKLLLMSGARLNELLTAKVDWIDWRAQVIRLPDSKSGAKCIFLSDAAIEVLREQIARIDGAREFIFPGRSSGHMINLRKSWVRVCERAGLQGIRLHDLRHTTASIAVGAGAGLPIVGRLLGHTQAQTTLRYAHVDTDPALHAANQVGEAVRRALG